MSNAVDNPSPPLRMISLNRQFVSSAVPNPAPSVAQAGLGFAAWARQNPQHANDPAPDGLLRWAQSTYPCPTTATSGRPARSGSAR